MKMLLLTSLGQLVLFFFLIAKDKNDGEKTLFKKQHWNSFDVFIIFLMYNFSYFLFFFLTGFNNLKWVVRAVPFILNLFLLLFLIFFFKFKIRRSIIILGFASINLKKNIVLGILTGFIAFIIFSTTFFLIGKDPLSLPLVKAMKDTTNPWYYLTFFLGVIVLFGPLVEEMFFRGILYSPYRKKYGPKIAIFFTSLFFYTAHIGGNFLEVIIIGIALGKLYEQTESLISTVFAHSSFNLLYLIIFYCLINVGRV